MIRSVQIENFKSIERMDLPLGRVNVLLGENGSGKSNILEAIGFGCAAAADKLDREFLAARGVRITRAPLVRCGFQMEAVDQPVAIGFVMEGDQHVRFSIQNDNSEYGGWQAQSQEWDAYIASSGPRRTRRPSGDLAGLLSYMIYAPQMVPLRALEQESLIEPLGIHGEGLFRLLQHLQTQGKRDEIRRHLTKIDWFEDVEAIESPIAPSSRAIRIRDHYMAEGLAAFDQHSANEGFLFFLFYICLFLSQDTPRFFAIDNVENSLNPKLCMNLMALIARLTKENDKQVILTTHNPAILDGLDLKDDEQRLFVTYRDVEGKSRIRRITYREPAQGEEPMRLSEAFLRGYLGGLPANF